MFTRINAAAVCCLLVSSASAAQTAVDFRDAVKTTAPATVAVMLDRDDVQRTARFQFRNNTVYPQNDLMRGFNFFADNAKPIRAGFAVAPDLVISCEITRNSEEVNLVTYDGRQLKGRVVVRDHVTGLAAIRIDGATLNAIEVAGETPQPGLPVLISWLHGGKTATSEASMIATDLNSDASDIGYSQKLNAAFTPEKLGAPVVDANGTLVGIVVSKAGSTICLPTIQVTRLVEAAAAETPSDLVRGMLGIQLNDQRDEEGGAMIVGVTDDTPAKEAGLEAGDKVTRIGDHHCQSHLDVMAAVAMSRAGDQVTLEFRRGEETLERTIRLASAGPEARTTRYLPFTPAQAMQQWLQLKDGKLVPMTENAPDGKINLANPQAWIDGNLQVERSEFEQSLKKLEAENARLKKIVEAITETLKAEKSDN